MTIPMTVLVSSATNLINRRHTHGNTLRRQHTHGTTVALQRGKTRYRAAATSHPKNSPHYGGAKPDTEQQQPHIQKKALKVRVVRKRTHEQYYICYSLGHIGRNKQPSIVYRLQTLEK